jgi:hypothetical protein
LGPSKEQILSAIHDAEKKLGHSPSKAEFISYSGITEYHITQNFESWTDAVRAAGLEPDLSNVRLDDKSLLQDWGRIVREKRHIPTRANYRKIGKFSPGVFDRHFGPWSSIPKVFRVYARDKQEWADVLELLPVEKQASHRANESMLAPESGTENASKRYLSRPDRATYGNPLDFRGLRHEPVNENGVVFLFGMVAKELGYLVEAVQSGFPDCEAKRQVGPGRWQRVRIEFEYESRNFRDQGHPAAGCDIIVCWNHNWDECPSHLEVVELSSIIRTLAVSEE